MIRGTRRKSAVLLAGISALIPLRAHSQVVAPVAAIAPVPFSPSDEPMILTRTVRRELPGGKEIVATRTYAIQMRPHESGFIVDGRLVDSSVEAPAALGALAALERARPDTGLFPIVLDGAGMIVPASAANTATVSSARLKAAEVASAAVNQSIPDAEAAMQAASFVRHVRDHGAASAWPVDLFRPRGDSERTASPVDTASGQGRVVVQTAAKSAPDSGLMLHFRRTVTTELGGSLRTSSEEWALQPAG